MHSARGRYVASTNGLTYTGLATLDQTVNPAQLDFSFSVGAAGNFVEFIGEIPKQ